MKAEPTFDNATHRSCRHFACAMAAAVALSAPGMYGGRLRIRRLRTIS
jgi:hypothetical protein